MTGTHYVYRNNLMRILCEKAGVPRFSYHAFRHFGASRLIQKGVPLTDVQQLLGHEKATTTAIYLRSMGDGVKEAVKKVIAPEKKKVSADEMFRLVSAKAQEIYVQRGCAAGDSLDDWYKAEALVKKELGL